MSPSHLELELEPCVEVLLTGFEPFEQAQINPAWEVARGLDGWRCQLPDGRQLRVRALQLRCVFGQAAQQLHAALQASSPALVICLGLAGGRAQICVERVAINLDDARIADNEGQQPVDRPVVADAPAAYFSTLPIKAIVRDLCAAGWPAAVSNTAGTFVCNHVFYALMHQLAERPGVRGGFVHLPYLPAQAAQLGALPSMALNDQIEALRVLIQTALTVQQDVVLSAGQLH